MRVFVTGMGAMTSLGNSVDQMFQGLLENRTGVRAYPEWAKKTGLHSHLGAPVAEYDPMKISRAARRSMSRMSEMATLATLQALAQADLAVGAGFDTRRILLCMGSTAASPETLSQYFQKFFEKGGPEGQLATTFFKVMNHTVPANVAAALGIHGPLLSPSSACSTSAQAMILGWELLQTGHYDMVIAGGADEMHDITSAIFDIVMAASRGYNDRPELSPRPFDKARDGLVVSEGASVVILETEASANRRGVRKQVEFRGGAYLCDGSHMSQSNAKAMTEVMGLALERAGLKATAVDYVNAHATGTQQGDQEEVVAVREAFGANVPISSLKGHFGHSLAACGALEVIASAKMIENGVLIPTRNLNEIDPGCGGVMHLTEKRPARVRTVLSNNFAFGGMNTSLLLSHPERD